MSAPEVASFNKETTDVGGALDQRPAEQTCSNTDIHTTSRLNARDERRLLRKIDLHVYPILFVVYMMSFLDRINISNARIQGMGDELDLSGSRFNIALFVSFLRVSERDIRCH